MAKLITRRGLLRAAGFAAPALIIPRAAGQFNGCPPGFCSPRASGVCAPSTNIWNTSDKFGSIVLSNIDKTATATNVDGGIRSVNSHTTGRWYLELHFTSTGNIFDNDGIGICISTTPLNNLYANATAFFIRNNGWYYNGGGFQGALNDLSGQIVGIAWNGSATWVRSEGTANVWQGTSGAANPATDTDGYPSPFSGNAVYAFMAGDGSATVVTDIHQTTTYTPPTGYCVF